MDWVATAAAAFPDKAGGGGGSSKKQKKHKKGENQQNIPPCYKAAMKQLARLSRDVEVLKACCFVSCKCKATHPIPAAALAAGRAYAEMVKGKSGKHSAGKPHCHVYAAMVMALAQNLPQTSPHLPMVNNFIAQIKAPTDLEDKVLHCVVRRQYKDDMAKVEWHVTPHTTDLSKVLMIAMTEGVEGSAQFFGPGPRNPNERKIMGYLYKSKKEGDEDDDED